jgi:hypothetical protein
LLVGLSDDYAQRQPGWSLFVSLYVFFLDLDFDFLGYSLGRTSSMGESSFSQGINLIFLLSRENSITFGFSSI